MCLLALVLNLFLASSVIAEEKPQRKATVELVHFIGDWSTRREIQMHPAFVDTGKVKKLVISLHDGVVVAVAEYWDGTTEVPILCEAKNDPADLMTCFSMFWVCLGNKTDVIALLNDVEGVMMKVVKFLWIEFAVAQGKVQKPNLDISIPHLYMAREDYTRNGGAIEVDLSIVRFRNSPMSPLQFAGEDPAFHASDVITRLFAKRPRH